jgi:3-hydroxyacyl-CoA dehydrogenase/enoyl-CoA hydratase/3-hydroxybutyryl-CoA epimerase
MHLRTDRDGRGVETITFDVQGVPMNVFNEEVFRELEAVVARMEREPPRLVVFRSAKASGFLAGADVHSIRGMKTADEARMVLAAGHELFDRVERLPFPTIAVIHGPCLGGGLEFALACRYRVARDDASTRIGLPEVMLGLIPGWGGTQRLPRAVGLRRALRMILEGATLTARKAAAAGLVDLSAPPETFDAEVGRFLDDRLAGRTVVRRSRRGVGGVLLDGTWLGRKLVFSAARKQVGKRAEHYPALLAALRAIQAGYGGSREAGFAAEREEFAGVVFTPTARNLIEVFLQRERARKRSTWVPDHVRPRPVERVAVLGAGVMGAGIAQLLAVNGVSVVLKDLNQELVAAGMKRVEVLTSEAAEKGVLSRDEAAAVVRNVTPTTAWEPLAGSDLVIEAVVEREDIKRDVFRELGARLPESAVLASNTSALSVSRIAEAAPRPERVAGLHFFNPVHRMHLVEVVRGRAADEETIATLVELVRKLGKVPVVVADSPGFLVNRLLFPYMDEAVRLVIDGVKPGPVGTHPLPPNGVPGPDVDREAVRFGMPMGPLELLDQVGIDIAADVAATFAPFRSEPGPTPERLAAMVREGALGKKSGRGFYEYNGGKRGRPTKWAKPGIVRPAPSGTTGELTVLQRQLIYPIINEAAKCLESGVVSEAWVIDLAMVLGTGFAPFRGGPLRTADSIGVSNVVRELDELRRWHGERFEAASLLRSMVAENRGFYTEVPEHEEAHR